MSSSQFQDSNIQQDLSNSCRKPSCLVDGTRLSAGPVVQATDRFAPLWHCLDIYRNCDIYVVATYGCQKPSTGTGLCLKQGLNGGFVPRVVWLVRENNAIVQWTSTLSRLLYSVAQHDLVPRKTSNVVAM
ncbi:hypothetical protein IAQ61_007660 [Plenodomus lingam]|uniref:uncharacterized protein n=1 Tax=Leptosphaeria maculans TaxID=5022 RepID=UPI0033194EB0|nr:hypothetical protein IAQ61_007660 [Plenodomus lingam]